MLLPILLMVSETPKKQRHEEEPPEIWHTVPFFGHIFGLFRHGHSYFKILRCEYSALCSVDWLTPMDSSDKYRLPIYTLKIFGLKIYVVNAPKLVVRIQSDSKAFSFNRIIAATIKMFCNLDPQTLTEYHDSAPSNGVHEGILNDMREAVNSALAPGPALDEMCTSMLRRLGPLLSELESNIQTPSEDLWLWVRRTTSLASTRAAYGPASPFDLDPELVDCFW